MLLPRSPSPSKHYFPIPLDSLEEEYRLRMADDGKLFREEFNVWRTLLPSRFPFLLYYPWLPFISAILSLPHISHRFIHSRCLAGSAVVRLRKQAEKKTGKRTDIRTSYPVSNNTCTDKSKHTTALHFILKHRDFVFFSWTDDHSRVLLSHIDGRMSSDYINASYIDVSNCLLFRNYKWLVVKLG